jgi:hypothetical protein
MSDIAGITDYRKDTINTFSEDCMGMPLFLQSASIGSNAWGSANTAMFIPFRIASIMKVAKVYWYNGSASTDHADFGIFDDQGNNLGSLGATAVSGSNARQEASLSVTLAPGNYYMGFVCNGTTASFKSFSITPPAGSLRCAGILQMASAYTLPSSVTYAANTLSVLPVIGITANST